MNKWLTLLSRMILKCVSDRVTVTLLKSILLNGTFIGYQAVSRYDLRSANCLCYKWFPSIVDIIFNHRKNVEYALFGLVRTGCDDKKIRRLNKWQIKIPVRLLWLLTRKSFVCFLIISFIIFKANQKKPFICDETSVDSS